MSLATRCPQCETALKISQSAAGKRVRCPKCRHAFQVSSVLFNDAATDVAALTTSMDTKPHGAIVGESQPLPP
ncbi:MAG: hypothetical protein FJ267_12410, partial [Planctomycetes bacterium]|nr:hypothetical protein [Planctomycetota bacterium]